MDSADPDQVRAAIEHHGRVLGRHQTKMEAALASFGDLTAQMQALLLSRSSAATPPSPQPPAPAHEPKLPPSQKYAGEPGTCRSFLSQCSVIFELQPTSFPSERSRVAYVITQLSRRAREWGTALWDAQSPSATTSRTSLTRWKGFLTGPNTGTRLLVNYYICARGKGPFRIMPSTSRPSQHPLAGTPTHSLIRSGTGCRRRSRTSWLPMIYPTPAMPWSTLPSESTWECNSADAWGLPGGPADSLWSPLSPNQHSSRRLRILDQNPCRWIAPVWPWLSGREDSPPVPACIVASQGTSSLPAR